MSRPLRAPPVLGEKADIANLDYVAYPFADPFRHDCRPDEFAAGVFLPHQYDRRLPASAFSPHSLVSPADADDVIQLDHLPKQSRPFASFHRHTSLETSIL